MAKARVVVVCGSPGAGKSTIAKSIARKFVASIIDKDTVEEQLVAVCLTEAGLGPADLFSELYLSRCKAASYRTMERMAADVTENGASCVLVAPFSSQMKNADEWTTQLGAECFGASVSLVWVTASVETLKDRIIRRAAPRDVAAHMGDWEQFVAVESARRPPGIPHCFLDTTNLGVEEMEVAATKAIQWIQEQFP